MLIAAPLFLALSLPSCLHGQAQGGAEGPVQEVIDRVAARYLKDGALEAVSIGVAAEGAAITGHYGPLRRDAEALATDSTIFEIRSITKTFTGTLAAQAVLDGKLSLNDDIRRYLDGEYTNLEFEGQPIRVRHLLTHTSGLPANNPEMEAAAASTPDGARAEPRWRAFRNAELAMTTETFLGNLAGFKLTTVPGTRFEYSNLGTNVMAHVLEEAYGRPFDELMEEHVLRPAGLKEAALALRTEPLIERLAGGYSGTGEYVPAWPEWPMWGAEGAIKATVPDVVRYMEFHLGEKSPAVKLSHVPLRKLDEGYWIAAFWWIIDTPEGGVSFRHDGGYETVRNVMILYPGDDLGIYAVTNRVTDEANGTLTALVRELRAEIRKVL